MTLKAIRLSGSGKETAIVLSFPHTVSISPTSFWIRSSPGDVTTSTLPAFFAATAASFSCLSFFRRSMWSGASEERRG